MYDDSEKLYKIIVENDLLDDDIEYSHQLYTKLISRDYMDISRPLTQEETFDHLANLADSMDQNTVEGAIAAVIIFNQIAEEVVYSFLGLIHFYIDLKMYPIRLKQKDSTGKTLGQLINEIEESFDFEYKEQLVKYGRAASQSRNRIVHELLRKENLESIQLEYQTFKNNIEKMFEAIDGSEKNPYQARERLFEMIKSFNKFSDEFHDKHRDLLQGVLESYDDTLLD